MPSNSSTPGAFDSKSLLHPLFALLASAVSAACAAENSNPPEMPADMAAWFEPPAEYQNQFGDFRSPLLFDDGSPVKTPADWARRREEILQRWHRIMGPWPPLLDQPKLEIRERTERENFTQCRVKVEVGPGRMVDGYLLLPHGDGKLPAVFVPFYDAETSVGLGKKDAPFRDFAYQLTKRGYVTLSIGSPGGDARKPEPGQAKCQPLSYLAYAAANCAKALADLPQVDPKRVGVVGHSFGGKWAMFASCLSERFACGVWSDAGIVFDEKRANVNYWDPWYLGAEEGPPRPIGLPGPDHPRTGAYRQLVENGMDLQELHALMAPRPFLVSGGSEDRPERWKALNHAVAVNQLLGYRRRVAFTSRAAHPPTDVSNEQIYRFFEHFL